MPKQALSSAPNHVAIIVDGNRRWAKERGLQPWDGHARGAEVVEKISKTAIDLGVKYLTVWGGSYNNLTKRTPAEIKFLDERMYRPWAQKGLKDKDIHDKQIRVRFIGEWPDLLSKRTQEAIRELEKATQDYSQHHLTYLIGYNGDREMVSAINQAIEKSGGVSEKNLKEFLWTGDLPPVDLVIRTGEENPTMPHNSTGFMMWHTKDSILYFTDKNWPDFTSDNLKSVFNRFSQKERRFGK